MPKHCCSLSFLTFFFIYFAKLPCYSKNQLLFPKFLCVCHLNVSNYVCMCSFPWTVLLLSIKVLLQALLLLLKFHVTLFCVLRSNVKGRASSFCLSIGDPINRSVQVLFLLIICISLMKLRGHSEGIYEGDLHRAIFVNICNEYFCGVGVVGCFRHIVPENTHVGIIFLFLDLLSSNCIMGCAYAE